MLPWIVSLLLTPRTFFSQRERETVSLTIPATIVVLPALMESLSALLGGPSSIHPLVWLLSVDSLIERIIMAVLAWGIFSVFFYYLGKKAGGTGSIEEVAQNTGYGMLPTVILSLFVLVVSSSRFWFLGIWKISGMDLYFIMIVGNVIFGSLWNGYLWIYGIYAAHAITISSSVMIVALVVILTVMVSLFPIFLILLTFS